MDDANLFSLGHGVVMALDMGYREISPIVDICNGTYGVVALKIGMIPMLSAGLPAIVRDLRGMTDLPLIYDHQKMGRTPPKPDDPAERNVFEDAFGMDGLEEGRFFGELLGELGIEGGIIFPLGGPRVQASYTDHFRRNGVIPFVLGRPTWDGVLEKEGGLFRNEAPDRIYAQAAQSGVEYYIMPGNRPGEVAGFISLIRGILPDGSKPKICLPGYGKQGGTVREAFRATAGLPSYAIIGPADCFDMSERDKVRGHIRRYCEEALEFE